MLLSLPELSGCQFARTSLCAAAAIRKPLQILSWDLTPPVLFLQETKSICTVSQHTTALTTAARQTTATACTEVLAQVGRFATLVSNYRVVEIKAACRCSQYNIHCAGSWYQGKFGRTSMSNIDEHQPTDETHHAHSMPAPQSIQCAYQGRFGTMPQAKMMEPQHSGELERKGSAYHGKFAQ